MEDLLQVAAFGNINDEHLEEAVLLNALRPRRNVQLRSVTYGRLNIERLTSEELRHYFRFEKEHIQRLSDALGIPNEIRTEKRYITSGMEGLCIYLRRLAYPNRLVDLERIFGLSAPYLSGISSAVMDIINYNKSYLIEDLHNLPWLNQNKFRYYANAISNKGAPMNNCWGFIDGTARPICRPSLNQEDYYSGHKRYHCVKYQSVLCPDGIVANLYGAVAGRRHDAGILRESNLYMQLEQCAVFPNRQRYALYGDSAYPVRELLLCPYANRQLTPQQLHFNNGMSSMRQAVEWGFGKIICLFAFLDFRKNQKLLLQDINGMYKSATILTNCHTCLYGSQTAHYFNTVPPALEEYLNA